MTAQAAHGFQGSRYTSYVAQRQGIQRTMATAATTTGMGGQPPAAPLPAAGTRPAGSGGAAALRLKLLGGLATLVLWSVTYLYRQPAVGGLAPGLAVEGMLLALAWLSALAAGCFAILAGWVEFREPGGR